MLYDRTRLPKNELIISNISLEAGFHNKIGLDLTLYNVSIRDFMN